MALKPVSAHSRVDGYIRVSRVGQRHGERFISPDVQREAIEFWSERLGFELLEVFEELDEPGSRATRPLLRLAVERIQLGVSMGLAVTRVDRFGRSLLDGVQVIERVRAAGGTFYAIEDGLDSSTDAGRMVAQILLSVAEYELGRIAAGWDTARERAIRRGLWVAKVVPVGHRKTRSGRLRPHPKAGPAMTEVFRRRAAGARLVSLCEYLEAEHVLTGYGNAD
jgi:site-specific DNA recombinase